jgi:hypothetical protein
MKLYFVTSRNGHTYKVLARGIDDAAWTCAHQLDHGDAVIRVELF